MTSHTTNCADVALVEAVDGLVWHALFRTGQWLRRRVPRRARGTAYKIHPTVLYRHMPVPVDWDLLEQHRVVEVAVLDRAPDIAGRHRVDAAWLTRTVAAYVCDLVKAGVEHHHHHLQSLLRDAPRVH